MRLVTVLAVYLAICVAAVRYAESRRRPGFPMLIGGHGWIIVKVDSSSGPVTIQMPGCPAMTGSTVALTSQYDYVELIDPKDRP